MPREMEENAREKSICVMNEVSVNGMVEGRDATLVSVPRFEFMQLLRIFHER